MPAAVMSKKEEIILQTAPFDPRFPNQNQTRYCWQSFVDFKRCQNAKGKDYEPCDYFKKIYKSLCPLEWVEKWEDQIEKNAFPADL